MSKTNDLPDYPQANIITEFDETTPLVEERVVYSNEPSPKTPERKNQQDLYVGDQLGETMDAVRKSLGENGDTPVIDLSVRKARDGKGEQGVKMKFC